MRNETFLYPNSEQVQRLLRFMYGLPSENGLRSLLANRVKNEDEKHPQILRFVNELLFNFRQQYSIKLDLTEEEIESLVTYLLAREDLDYTFLNEVYRVYNEALKRSIVQTSRFPTAAAVFYDVNAFFAKAAGQIHEAFS